MGAWPETGSVFIATCALLCDSDQDYQNYIKLYQINQIILNKEPKSNLRYPLKCQASSFLLYLFSVLQGFLYRLKLYK